MFRLLHIELPGANYHVTTLGDQRKPIFENDGDRAAQRAGGGHAAL